MATVQHNKTTAVSMPQIGISRNTKCANKDGFRRDSHIRNKKLHVCQTVIVSVPFKGM